MMTNKHGVGSRALWACVAAAMACACGGQVATPGTRSSPPPGSGAEPASGVIVSSSGQPMDAGWTTDSSGPTQTLPIASSEPLAIDASAPIEPFTPPVATQLIDDMGNLRPDGPGMSGGWGTYSDRAVSWSEPPIFTIDVGSLVPTDGTPVFPVMDGSGPVFQATDVNTGNIVAAPQPYRRFTGAGESTWGAGLALNFAGAPPDGGAFSMNECDGGVLFDVNAADHDSLVQLPFDASGWTGIQFWARSMNGQQRIVTFIIQDDWSNPFGKAADAGGCNVCAGGGLGGCGDGPRTVVTVPTGWSHIQVPFSALQPNGWSGVKRTRSPDTSALYSMNFEIEDVPLPPFDVAVAYVEFYK